jgi:tRNA pseudouridine55 synthase
MATGVLVVGVERATRLLTYLVGTDKVYRATVRLGQSTVTDDADGEVIGGDGAERLDESAVRTALSACVGTIDQVPSSVSAIKVDGVRSYARVRRGQDVALAARRVTIHRIDWYGSSPARAENGTPVLDVDVEVACSSGTYVRAIARDVGVALGVGGHLTRLRRTAVGAFTIDQASTLDTLAARPDPVTVSLEEVAAAVFPRRDADEEEARVLAHGGRLRAVGTVGPYAVFGPDGRVIAIVAEDDGRARPEVVLAPAGAERS